MIDEPPLDRLTRRPAAVITVALAVGILVSRWLQIHVPVWLLISLLSLVCWQFFLRRGLRGISCLALLSLCLSLGGARHQMSRNRIEEDDLFTFATESPQPVRLIAEVDSRPVLLSETDVTAFSAWQNPNRTIFRARCHSLNRGHGSTPVSGIAQVAVNGHLSDLRSGDVIEVVGHLRVPPPPKNPGEFDYRDYLRNQGVHTLIRADFPEAIEWISRRRENDWRRWRDVVRDRCEQLMAEHVSDSTRPVAEALLLGRRSDIPDDVRDAFAESGTMHLLAISGLHVGILAGALWFLCRCFNLSRRSSVLFLLLTIGLYAAVTEARPPVLRASILLAILAAGRFQLRQVDAVNALAIAGLIILILNPTDLFNTGAQLSFLAFAAILWMTSFSRRWLSGREAVQLRSDGSEAGFLHRTKAYVLEWACVGYLVTAAIWAFCTPLIVYEFHLISPIGFIVNVLLIPVVMVAVLLGFAFLVLGSLSKVLAVLLSSGLDFVLDLLLDVVRWTASLRTGHFYVAGPEGWWVGAFYLLLFGVIVFPRHRRWRVAGWCALWVWILVGLIDGMWPTRSTNLRVTFLSVGHGCSVVIENPKGSVLVYDAGSINNARRARSIVQSAIWSRGHSRINTLVLSHADIDHYSGAAGLLNNGIVGSLDVARSFLDFGQTGVVDVCDKAAHNAVPIRLISRGDRYRSDPTVECRVLHPGSVAMQNDNANSVVLLIEFSGRRILLTGDLEEDGLQRVLSRPIEPIDIMLAPHHGSRNSNTKALADWARPRWVVVSSNRTQMLPVLKQIYGRESAVLSTAESGAVTFEISPAGEVHSIPFLAELRAE